MMKVLLHTEFTPASNNSLCYVLGLFKSASIPIQIMLVNTYIVQQTDPNQVIAANDEMKRKSKAKLDLEASRAKELNSNTNITFETFSHMGSLHNVFSQLASKNEINLAVIAREDVNQTEGIATMLRKSQCPLLVT